MPAAQMAVVCCAFAWSHGAAVAPPPAPAHLRAVEHLASPWLEDNASFGVEAGLPGHLLESVNVDDEATVLDFSAVGAETLHKGWGDSVIHALGWDKEWPDKNPKNGTPWYRFKRVGERGAAGHPHFGGLTATGDFNFDILHAHNEVRTRVGLAPLEWSAHLAGMASARVKKLAGDGCYIRHSPTSDRWETGGFTYVGENLYKVINMAPTGVDIVDAWYAEVCDYNYGPVGSTCTRALCADRKSPPCTLGHFTQVMWAPTNHVGCALAECPNQPRQTYVAVCNYGPGGNIRGRLPFGSAHAQAIGLNSEVCTTPGISPFNLARRQKREAELRSEAARVSAMRAVLLTLGLAVATGLL